MSCAAQILLALLLLGLAPLSESDSNGGGGSGGGVDSESGDFYLIQFSRSITSDLLARLTDLLDCEPTDFVPRNAVVVWIDASKLDDPVAELPALLPAIKFVHVLDKKYRSVDMKKTLASLRVQHRRFNKIALANNSAPVDSTVRYSDAYERDNSGTVVVQLIVKCRESLKEERLHFIGNSHSRTSVRVTRSERADEKSGGDGSKLTLHRRATQRRSRLKKALLSNVHVDDAERLTDALLLERRVVWVQLRSPYQTFNRWAIPSMLYVGGGDQRTLPRRTSLIGHGQTLSISDTGVEINCMFADPAGRAVPYTSTQSVPPDTGHAVVRAYWSGTGGDFHDQGAGAGHGSHVCATALGRCNASTTRDYQGGAPGARLVFIDLLPNNGGDFLQVPLEIDRTLFQFSYACGAFVHGGSWGSTCNGVYGEDEAAVDRFCYDNRRFLPVFAGGNAGPDLGTGSSPAYAKNALSVGAAMNGAAAYSLAGGSPRVPGDFANDWLADFSSVGDPAFGLTMIDVVVAAGDFVWSDDADAPAGTNCSNAARVLTGMAGTSMGAPQVEAAAIITREYFQKGYYPNSAGVATAGDTRDPMASLLAAMIISSAVPLRGTYPQKPFRNAADRINRSGFGRVVMARVWELADGATPSVQTVVLSNEAPSLGLAEGESALWCMELTGRVTPDDTVTVTMVYTDYPSSPLARASLVNDLRLEVVLEWTTLLVNELPRGVNELRTTKERVVAPVQSPTVLAVRVAADDIGFGQRQTFSLLVVLHRGAGGTLSITNITAPLLVGKNGNETCARCKPNPAAKTVFVPRSQCSQCGNGIVETISEQCDSSECCDPTTCRVLADRSPCAVMVGECRVQGTCQGTSLLCVADTTLRYVNSLDGSAKCQPTKADQIVVDAPPPVPTPQHREDVPSTAVCTTMSSTQWRTALSLNRALAGDRHFCCTPLWAVFEMIRFEPLFVDLAQEYAAALLNSLQPGAVVDAQQMMLIAATSEFLQPYCTTGLVTQVARTSGQAMLLQLRAVNKFCATGPAPEPANRCGATAAAVRSHQTAAAAATLSSLFCSNGAGRYDIESDTCTCAADRQQSEPDCAHLACSGNGASIFDSKHNIDTCTCLFGWRGDACEQCATTPSDSRLVYHCVGVAQAMLGEVATRHYLRPVLRDSVPRRLNGQYYAGVEKVADGVPGVADLDCWCREPSEVVRASSSASHQAAYALAQRQYEAMMEAGALSDEAVGRQSTYEREGGAAASSSPVVRHVRKSRGSSSVFGQLLPVMDEFPVDDENNGANVAHAVAWQQEMSAAVPTQQRSNARRASPIVQIAALISLAFVRSVIR